MGLQHTWHNTHKFYVIRTTSESIYVHNTLSYVQITWAQSLTFYKRNAQNGIDVIHTNMHQLTYYYAQWLLLHCFIVCVLDILHPLAYSFFFPFLMQRLRGNSTTWGFTTQQPHLNYFTFKTWPKSLDTKKKNRDSISGMKIYFE